MSQTSSHSRRLHSKPKFGANRKIDFTFGISPNLPSAASGGYPAGSWAVRSCLRGPSTTKSQLPPNPDTGGDSVSSVPPCLAEDLHTRGEAGRCGMSSACCRPRHAPTRAVFSAAPRLRPAVGKPAYWGVPAASAATVPGSPARSSPSAAVSRPPTDLASGPFCAGPIPVPVLSHKLR